MRRIFALFFIVSNIFCAYAQSTDGITTITPSVPPGAYPTDQIVNLVTNDDVDLYFTFDESRDQTFARYTVPIRLNALTGESRSYTLRVEARRNGLILKKKEFFYIIDRDPPELPAPTVAPGTYTSSVALSFDTSNFKSTDRLYTTVANTEIPAPALWDGVDIVLDVEEGSTSGYELRAYAIDSAGNSSCMGSWYYVIDRSVEQIPDKLRVYSPVPGEFANKQLLLIDPDGFDEIRYAYDGEDPISNGYKYSGPVLIDRIGTIKLDVFGYIDGVVEPLAQTVLFKVIENTVDRLRTESGLYDEAILITLRDSGNAVYTLDDALSTAHGLAYTGPIRLTPLANSIRFIPFRYTTDTDEPEYRYTFIIDDRTPTPPDIRVSQSQPVTQTTNISIDAPPFATVYLTVDGTTPDADSAVYENPFEFELPANREAGSVIIKAVAIGQNGRTSELSSELIIFDLVAPEQPEISYLGKSGTSGIAVGVDSEFGSVVHYELTLDDTSPVEPTTGSPIMDELLRLEVPYGMERMFSLRFAAADTAGNMSAPTEPFRLLVDRVPPMPPTVAIVDDALQISGEGSVYYTITEDGSFPPIPTVSSLLYASPVQLSISPGRKITYRILAAAADTSGNISDTSDLFSISYDARTPVVPGLRDITDGGFYRDSVRISLQRGPEELLLYYTVAENAEADNPDATSNQIIDFIELDGTENAVVEYDLKILPMLASTGAIGEIADYRFTIDRSLPDIPVFPELSRSPYRNTSVEIRPPTGYADSLRYAVSLDANGELDPFGVDSATFNSPLEFDAPLGTSRSFFLAFGAEDTAGNRAIGDRTYEITIDREPPGVPSMTGVPTTSISREPVIVELASDDGEVRYLVSSDGSVPSRSNAIERRYAGPLVLSGDDEQEITYSVVYYAIDRAQNSSKEGYLRVTIDRLAPDPPPPPDVSVSDSGELMVAFPGACNAQVYYRLDNLAGSSGFSPYSEPTILSNLVESATATISYYSRDRAGNQSELKNYLIPSTRIGADALLSGVMDGETYNTRKRVQRGRDSGITRYEIRSDGVEPNGIGRYSPVMPTALDLDAEIGRTNRYAVRLAWFRNPTDLVPSEVQLIRFTIDRNPPPPPELAISNDQMYSRQDMAIEFTTTEGDIFISINGRSFSRYAESLSLTAEEGSLETYTVTAYSRDSAENRSIGTSEWTIIIDKSDVYVSVAGNDLYDGSRSRPFRTVERAVQEAQQTKRSVINLASGVYVLREPLTVLKDLTFRGALSRETWLSDPENPSKILATTSFPDLPLITVDNSELFLKDIELVSDDETPVQPLLRAQSAVIKFDSVLLYSDIRRFSPIASFRDSVIEMNDVIIRGAVEDSSVVDVTDSESVSIVGTTLFGDTVTAASTALSITRSPSVVINNSIVRGANARTSIALRSYESTIQMENSTVTAGAGRASSIAVSLFDSTLRTIRCVIEGSSQSWIGTSLKAEYSNVLIDRSAIYARGNRGAVAISTEGTSIDVSRSIVRGELADEFIYLLQASNSDGSVVNSMLSSGESRDQIAIDLSDSPISFYHDTIRLGAAKNLSIGVRIHRGQPPYFVNTIFDGGVTDFPSETLTTSIAIQSERNVPNPRLLGNAFGGFVNLMRIDTTVYRTVADLNRRLDGDPEGGNVQLNIALGKSDGIETESDGTIHIQAGSIPVNSGIDLNLIGLRITDDYFGTVRPKGRTAQSSGYDIGAEEVE